MTTTTDANNRMNRPLDTVDPAIAELLRDEARRQATGLELIPSENLVSEAVLEAMGSIFTNKYAEGYPGKRYYGGCEFADKVEQLAIDRAKQIFGAEHANVQSQKNWTNSRSPEFRAARLYTPSPRRRCASRKPWNHRSRNTSSRSRKMP